MFDFLFWCGGVMLGFGLRLHCVAFWQRKYHRKEKENDILLMRFEELLKDYKVLEFKIKKREGQINY